MPEKCGGLSWPETKTARFSLAGGSLWERVGLTGHTLSLEGAQSQTLWAGDGGRGGAYSTGFAFMNSGR